MEEGLAARERARMEEEVQEPSGDEDNLKHQEQSPQTHGKVPGTESIKMKKRRKRKNRVQHNNQREAQAKRK